MIRAVFYSLRIYAIMGRTIRTGLLVGTTGISYFVLTLVGHFETRPPGTINLVLVVDTRIERHYRYVLWQCISILLEQNLHQACKTSDYR